MRGLLRIVPAIVLLLAAVAAGQDFNMYGFTNMDLGLLGAGARARAMGGAFVGVADDASALTWNPAGLVQVQKTQTSVAGSWTDLKQETSYSGRDFEAEESDTKTKLAYASFVAPLRIKGHPFMAAVTYRAAHNRLEDWYSWSQVDEVYVAFPNIIEYTADRTHHTTITGGFDIFSLGFGTGFYGDLSVGGAVNIFTGSGEAFYRNHYLDTVVTDFAGVSDTIQLRRAFSTGDEIDYKGFNLTASAFYEYEMVRVGVTLQTPTELVMEHDLTRRDTLYENGLPIGQRAWLFRNKSKLELPLTLAGGVSVQATPDLVLSGDFELKRFSESKYLVERDTLFTKRGSIYFPYHCIDVDTCDFSRFTSAGEEVEVFDEFDLGYGNWTSIRVGAEYMLRTPIGNIPIRGGGRITNEQYRDAAGIVRDELDQLQSGFALKDRVTSTTVTFGSGIHWRQIWLDVAVELSSEEQTLSGSDYRGSFEVTKTRTSPTVIFNFTGFF
jgi:hypothetical protein